MITRTVNEIPDDARRTLEGLLGRQLEANQQLFVMVLSPSQVPNDETRQKAAQGLRELMAQAETHAAAQGVTGQDVDEAVDEAMAYVRRRPA